MPFFRCYACGQPDLHSWAGNIVWIKGQVDIPLCKSCERKAWKEHIGDHPQHEWMQDQCMGIQEWTIHENALWKSFHPSAIAWAERERSF